MRKATRNLLLLVLAVIVLGVAVYAQLVRERARAVQALTAIDTATVQRLEIHCAQCITRIFARRDGIWYMLQPHAAPADPEAVERLLGVAHARVRTRAPLAAYDAARLGLAPPQFRVVIDTTQIDIGGEDPIDHDRYVRIGDELLHVPDRFSARLLESPESELRNPKAAQ